MTGGRFSWPAITTISLVLLIDLKSNTGGNGSTTGKGSGVVVVVVVVFGISSKNWIFGNVNVSLPA